MKLSKAFQDWLLHVAVPKQMSVPLKPKEHVWCNQNHCSECGMLKSDYLKIRPEFRTLPCGSLHRIQFATGYCVSCGLPAWYIRAHWHVMSICPGIIDITDCPIMFPIS